MSYEKVRRFPRIKTLLAVQIETLNDPNSISAVAVELSEGGCLLRSAQPEGVGRILVLSLSLGFTSTRIIARVIYEYPDASGNFLIGMSFVSLFPDELMALREFIALALSGQQAHN